MLTQLRRGVAAGVTALLLGAGVCAQPTQTTSAEEWSTRLWSTAREGEAAQLADLLGQAAHAEDGALAAIRGNVDRYQSSLAKQAQDREARTAEVRGELADHLTKAQGEATELELGRALISALELIELHGGMPEADAILHDAQVIELVTRADAAAHEAEAAGRWLFASELFYRLHVLFDVDQRYKGDADRQASRLAMLRLYVPEYFWELRNQRQVAEGLPELPPYNPRGDTYQEKLEGIDPWLLIRSIQVSGEKHVDGTKTAELLLGGLDGVSTMVKTEALAKVFPGLGDQAAVEKFLATLAEQENRLNALNGPADQRDIRSTVERLVEANDDSVRLPREPLLHEFGNAAMGVLDDYSVIVWPDEVRRFERSTRGEFYGVGIQIENDELQRIRVVTPLEGTPAQRAGVHAGDIITKVDGEATVGFTLDQAVDVITGPPGTDVSVTVDRAEGEAVREITFELTRTPIKLGSVKGWRKDAPGDDAWEWMVDAESGIGYIRLTQFTESSTQDFENAIRAMQRQGLNALILDLRFNPGGLLDQAVGIVGQFVQDGVVVTTEDAGGVTTGAERTAGRGALADLPVAVLINEGSASASEIVAGALQDYAAQGAVDAILIGKRSFGKGSVQNAWPLPVRARSLLKVTTQYYRLPGGRLIHRRPGATEWGVNPDLVVDMLPSQNEQALLLRRDADVLPLDENGNVVATETPRPNPEDLLTKGIDLQLDAAVMLLKGRVLGEQAQAEGRKAPPPGDA